MYSAWRIPVSLCDSCLADDRLHLPVIRSLSLRMCRSFPLEPFVWRSPSRWEHSDAEWRLLYLACFDLFLTFSPPTN